MVTIVHEFEPLIGKCFDIDGIEYVYKGHKDSYWTKSGCPRVYLFEGENRNIKVVNYPEMKKIMVKN